MKHTIGRTTFFVFCLAAVLALAPPAQAEPCSMASGAGTFGFNLNGLLITPAGSAVPVAAVGTFKAEAAGTLTGTETRSVGGEIAEETITGTFSISADCTAKYTFQVFEGGRPVRTTKADVVIVNHAQESLAIFTSVVLPDGTSLRPILSASTKRISRGDSN